MKKLLLCATLALAGIASPLQAQDMPLSTVLIEGEKWEVAAEGFKFTDAPCADAAGNFYFSDVGAGGLYKISSDGKVGRFLPNAPKLSGIKWGADGRLYGCAGADKQIVALSTNGAVSVLATNVEPNDLVVLHNGGIYFTETGKKQVTFVTAQGQLRAVDVGIRQPNGLTLSPDQGTLMVDDFGGSNVYAFRIERDGSLSAKQAYMTVRTPVGKVESSADGMTVDADGRYYVASAMGVQMFDPTGRMGGVIAKPQEKFLCSVAFAGPNLEYLYAACSDKIYRRKTKVKGVLFFQPPLLAAEKKQ